MEHTSCSARASRARSVWLRMLLALGLLFGMGNAAAQCSLTATVATPYSQSFNVTGGTAPYTWSISAGALPAGVALTYSGASALISGTPTAGGNFSFTIKVVHATGSGTLACTLAVAPPSMILGPPSLASATWGMPYSNTVAATGGTTPYTYAVTSGSLPPGMSLGITGALSGTPTAAGTFLFTVTATDNSTGTGPYTVSRSYTFVVMPPTIDISPATLPPATVGQAFSQSLTASGGTAPYSYALSSGTLPPGLSLSATGEIAGTPTAGGSFNFDVTATDANGFTGTRSYTLGVAAPAIAITPATLTNAVAGTGYSQSISASGGTAPYGYEVSSGTLPAGLTLSPTGMLSGTPTVAGSFNFTVKATDSSSGSGPYFGLQAYTLVVDAPTIAVTPASLPGGSAGTAYAQTLSASGGVASYTWSLVSGALPVGMAFSSAGTLSGTPTVAGSFSFTVRATDANGFTGDQAYTLAIAAPTISITPATLPAGTGGTAYAQTLAASGGVSPYAWSLVAGSLPTGMSLSSTGNLSGTPTVAGSFSFTVRATDANGFTADQAYTLAIAAPTISVSPATLPAGTGGVAYAQTLAASGGVSPYTWSLVAGSLPTGMSLSSTGNLSGTPTVAGSFSFTVRATDANGFTADQAYTLAIAAPTLSLTPTTLPAGAGGVAYTQALSTSGGTAPYGYAVSAGSLPAGMTLSSAGVVSGTPTVAGSFSVTVRATDANGFTADQAYTLAISAPTIAVTPSTLPAGTAGTAYAQTFAASGGTGPYTYALAGGALPPGLTLSASGVLAGTPAGVDDFDITIRATDANGFTGEQAYTLSVAALVPVAGNDSAHTTAVQAVTVDITANDTGGPFTAAAVLSVAPSNAGTATIAQSGSAFLLTFTPAADFSGPASVRYTVSNAYATSAAATLDVLVEGRPDPSRDPDVLGLLSAQANATRGFARAQIGNVQQRMESLHGGVDGNGWRNSLSLATGTRCDRSISTGNTESACPQTQATDADATTAAPQQASAAPAGFWTAGSFGSGERDFRFGRSALDFESSGLSIGTDYRFSGAFVLGAALGYGRDRTNVGVHETRADGTAYSAMAYASWSPSTATFVDAVFGYQRLSFDTRRTVAANGSTVTGSRDGTQWFGSLSAGYEYRNGGLVVAPYGRIDLADGKLDAYAESGDAIHALRYGQQAVETGTASLGLRVEQQLRQEWGVFSPLLRIEHQHDFQGQGSTTLQYADLPAGPFYRTFGDTFDRSRWLLGLGAGFTFSDALGLKFEYLYVGDGHRAEDQTLRVILQVSF